MEPRPRLELGTPSLPWKCSTAELSRHQYVVLEVGLDSKNDVLHFQHTDRYVVLEVGLEPTKREAREIYSLLSLPLDDSSN